MDELEDPFGDRVMKNVPPMARFPLTKEELWHDSRKYPECLHFNQYSSIFDLFA